MKAVVPFAFEGKPVRVMPDQNGELWFAATDACRILDVAHAASATRILDNDEKGVRTMQTLGGMQDIAAISEPGLYKRMSRSRKPQAKRFDRWVRHEVLPSIRKTGGYGAQDIPAALNDPSTLRRLLLEYAEKVIALPAENIELVAKGLALARIAMMDDSLSITDAAKTLQVQRKDLL